VELPLSISPELPPPLLPLDPLDPLDPPEEELPELLLVSPLDPPDVLPVLPELVEPLLPPLDPPLPLVLPLPAPELVDPLFGTLVLSGDEHATINVRSQRRRIVVPSSTFATVHGRVWGVDATVDIRSGQARLSDKYDERIRVQNNIMF
jgi:hypothetical protein